MDKDRRLIRWMGPCAILMVTLFIVGLGPLAGQTPSENASAARILRLYSGAEIRQWAVIYFVGAALMLFLFYSICLRIGLRDGAHGQEILPTLALVGAIVFVAGFVADTSWHVALLLAARNNDGEIAHLLNFVDQNDNLPIIFGAAATAFSSGLSMLYHSSFSKLLAWSSIVVGLLCVAGPISFVGIIAFGLWLIVTGFVIAARARARDDRPAPAE